MAIISTPAPARLKAIFRPSCQAQSHAIIVFKAPCADLTLVRSHLHMDLPFSTDTSSFPALSSHCIQSQRDLWKYVFGSLHSFADFFLHCFHEKLKILIFTYMAFLN